MANHALPAASRAGMSKKGCISCIGINAATKNEVEKHATMIVCVAERLEEEGYVTRLWPNRQSAIGQPHYITCSCLPFAQEAIASIKWKRHGHLLGCSAPNYLRDYIRCGGLKKVLCVNTKGVPCTPAATSRRATPLILVSNAWNVSIASASSAFLLLNMESCCSASFLIRHSRSSESTVTAKHTPSSVKCGAVLYWLMLCSCNWRKMAASDDCLIWPNAAATYRYGMLLRRSLGSHEKRESGRGNPAANTGGETHEFSYANK